MASRSLADGLAGKQGHAAKSGVRGQGPSAHGLRPARCAWPHTRSQRVGWPNIESMFVRGHNMKRDFPGRGASGERVGVPYPLGEHVPRQGAGASSITFDARGIEPAAVADLGPRVRSVRRWLHTAALMHCSESEDAERAAEW